MTYTLMLFCPRVTAGIWMSSIAAEVFEFNNSVYGVLPFLFPRASILAGLNSNAVAESLSTWNTKSFLTPCPNPFLRFPNAEPAEWIRIRSCDTCTLTR